MNSGAKFELSGTIWKGVIPGVLVLFQNAPFTPMLILKPTVLFYLKKHKPELFPGLGLFK